MAFDPDTLFPLLGWRVKLLQPEDTATLQTLLERCADYSRLVTGSPPGPAAAASLLTDCPPGKTVSDKCAIGIFTERQELTGVLDAVRGYPTPVDWWLGLLLLDPAVRGQGLGQRLYQAFEGWAAQQGARCIYLGVVEDNQAAYRFWRKTGFQEVERQPARQFGVAQHVVITMARRLAG